MTHLEVLSLTLRLIMNTDKNQWGLQNMQTYVYIA